MYMENKLHRLFNTLPIVCVLGNGSDFSRYRYMIQLSEFLAGRENWINRYIKDKVNVVIYPERYGTAIYLKKNDTILTIADMEDLPDEDPKEVEALIIGGHMQTQNCLYEFPGAWDENYEFSFSGRMMQMVLIESFPYGKESFIKLVDDAIRTYPFSTALKIMLYQSSIKYGATDITNMDEAVGKAVERLGGYTKDLDIISEDLKKETGYCIHISEQYRLRKRKLLEETFVIFENSFDFDYKNAVERYLMTEEDENKGILSEQAFGYAARYENVRNTDDVERKIFDNYMKIVRSNRGLLIQMTKYLYLVYLSEFVEMEQVHFEKFTDSLISELSRKYQYQSRTKCPSNPIEYRKVCNEKRYLIRMKEYVNETIDRCIYKKIREDIQKELKDCEARCL